MRELFIKNPCLARVALQVSFVETRKVKVNQTRELFNIDLSRILRKALITRMTGLEPVTFDVTGQYSNHLSYILLPFSILFIKKCFTRLKVLCGKQKFNLIFFLIFYFYLNMEYLNKVKLYFLTSESFS